MLHHKNVLPCKFSKNYSIPVRYRSHYWLEKSSDIINILVSKIFWFNKHKQKPDPVTYIHALSIDFARNPHKEIHSHHTKRIKKSQQSGTQSVKETLIWSTTSLKEKFLFLFSFFSFFLNIFKTSLSDSTCT